MEIVPGIHQIDGVNANSYLIIKGKEATLIDTGLPGSAKKILSYAEKNGLKPSDIKTVVITHHHPDHTGSLCNIVKASGAKVAVHAEDAGYVSGKKKQAIKVKNIRTFLFKVLRRFFGSKSIEPDIILKEGDRVDDFTVIHTPGHTPGSISLYDQDRKIIFVGDALRYVKGIIQGSPELFSSDHAMAKQSISKIANLEFDILLSGHGQPLMPKASDRVKEYASMELKK
jgi:hydroxyacylglutathione hydrolase